MREVEGYLSIGSTGSLDVFFGPDNSGEGRGAQQFQTNGLQAFSSLQEARVAKEEIGKRIKDLSNFRIAKIKLSIVESQEDINSLKGMQGFVVIIDRGFDQLLIGEYVEGKPSLNIGGPFQANGQRPIKDLDEALWNASEAVRQEVGPSRVARVVFEEVE